MPVISRFFGSDHDPPHFHARYQRSVAVIDIRSGKVSGDLPPRALRLLHKWADLHREELEVNWTRARDHKHLLPVEPLS